jgi:hypothetical protein
VLIRYSGGSYDFIKQSLFVRFSPIEGWLEHRLFTEDVSVPEVSGFAGSRAPIRQAGHGHSYAQEAT